MSAGNMSNRIRNLGTVATVVVTSMIVLSLVATACSSDDVVGDRVLGQAGDEGGDVIELGDDEIVLASALGTLPNCDALLDYLRVEGANSVGAYGFDGDGWFGPTVDMAFEGDAMDEMAMEDDAMEESSTADVASGAADTVTNASSSDGFDQAAPAAPQAAAIGEKAVEGVDFSGTTVQELGIDEPDIIKTDGERILVISNGVFSVIDARGDDARIAGQLRLNGDTYIREMLVVGDRALLFGEGWSYTGGPVPLPAVSEPAIETAPPAKEAEGDAEAGFAQVEPLPTPEPFNDSPVPDFGGEGPAAMMFELDLSDEARPTIASRMAVEGRYLSARLVGGIARVAVQSNPNQLPFVFPRNSNGEDAAREANRNAVGQSTLEDWLPTFSIDRNGVEVERGLLTACDRVHVPSSFSGFGSLSLLSFDMAAPLGNGQAATVMASGETVYASDTSVYLATNNWFDPALSTEDRGRLSEAYTTSVHSFDISGGAASYSASGSVRGHLLNQFALSEHNGHLRVATTDGAPWGGDGSTSESFVQVLERQGDELVVIGSVGDMGRGETIRSVRFVGDIAYVVTFRQTDPFYTVDLSQPTAPVVRGELKITGYSGQLHPIGENLVLGIGQEATEEGQTTGAKMTLFDVADLDNPIDIDTWVLPNAYTEAEWDHRSFLWWAPQNLAVFPINSWSENFWGAVAFRVDRENGISEVGRIDHGDDEEVEVGRTNCTVLTGDDLRGLQSAVDENSDLYWMLEEFSFMADEGQVQRCGDGQGGAAGMSCYEEFPIDMLRDGGIDVAALGVSPDDRFEMCWPEGPGDDPIIRTLVIGDELWSLSYGALQSNLLADLSRTQRLPIQ